MSGFYYFSTDTTKLICRSIYGADRHIITSHTNNVYSLARQNGYIEFMTDGGAKGVTYNDSDERMKVIHGKAESNALEEVKSVEMISYSFKEGYGYDSNQVYRRGFSAQNLQKIDPMHVNEMSNGMLRLNTSYQRVLVLARTVSVSYSHLTLPTSDSVYPSVVALSFHESTDPVI
ncbi:tail fiber domain-containing protein [Aureimonas ureilytica]|uniref:tail fiber domain-containing protein n=1 Tax=Aureimonas ureilytica TaxID=401562 RepID=UPI0019D4D748|nr:tail fiber domain-containing protein [Aureimonas ureilytica]